jgi:hypothetical protein
MSSKSLYFSKAPLRGPGKLHFLVTPMLASPGTDVRSLLGSLVTEMDEGTFGDKQIPGADHVWKRRYVLDVLGKDPALAGQNLVSEATLANVSQDLKVDKKLKLGVDATVPGVPAKATIGFDYSKTKTINIALGEGCVKEYIPEGFLASGYRHAELHSNEFDRQLFNDDYMAVSQLLIVRKMQLTVESQTEFSAAFQAQAEQISGLGLGVDYSKKSNKKYVITLDDGLEYLFGIGAVQLEKLR